MYICGKTSELTMPIFPFLGKLALPLFVFQLEHCHCSGSRKCKIRREVLYLRWGDGCSVGEVIIESLAEHSGEVTVKGFFSKDEHSV